jgi:hypothetical protein
MKKLISGRLNRASSRCRVAEESCIEMAHFRNRVIAQERAGYPTNPGPLADQVTDTAIVLAGTASVPELVVEPTGW